MTRSTAHDAPHRLIFTSDLDRLPHDRALWQHGPDDALSPERDALHAALRHAIRHDLTDKQRQAVELFFFDGLTQDQIAQRLGIRQQVVHKRLYGALRSGRRVGGAIARLRRALSNAGYPSPKPHHAP